MFEFTVTDSFVKSLHQLEKKTQNAIKKKLHLFSQIEKPLYFAKKLKDKKDIFRFRTGNYRVIFRLDKNEIILLLVKHRKDIYNEKF